MKFKVNIMKVIGAGYSKTGTKTLNAALTILGYKVYDFMEHFWFHQHYWNKIFDSKGTKSDFKAMYENVDAVTDCPANFFWEEIHQAFPDSKVPFFLKRAVFQTHTNLRTPADVSFLFTQPSISEQLVQCAKDKNFANL